MTTPPDGTPGSGLPPHLDPRGRQVPRVTEAYREAARGPQVRTAGPRSPYSPRPPLPTGPSRGRRVGRVLSWIALSMAIVILGTAAVGYVLVRHYDGNVQRLGGVFSNITGRGAPAKAPKNAENVLLVGSDSRAGSNGRGTGGSGLTAGQRSDTIILAHLYGKSDKALFVSFPRDSYVEIPAWTDPKSGMVHGSHHDKINSAISEGGPALLIATVEKLTDIRIDHYVQIDFVGFKSMVNRLGGVDVCLRHDEHDVKSKLNLAAGRHHIDGTVALAFVRQRHGLPGGDLDRIKRQQQLIGSMVHKVLSAGTLINPLKLNGFLNAATSSLQVDNHMTFTDMKDIALRARGFSSGGVLFTTVPVANAAGRINGASVVLLDESADAALFDALRRDVAPGTAPKPTVSALTVKPGNIRVRVFNGSGVSGLGRKAFNDLTAIGFATTSTPTNRGSGATATTIFYGPNKADSAKTLAAALPGAVLQEDPSLLGTLEVVVGSSYTGAQPVHVTGTPAPTTSPATPAIRTAQDDVCSA